MLRKLLAVVLFAVCSIFAFSQSKPNLGILPFTGVSGGDGETIAALFSNQPDIREAFTVVPRTSAVNALIAEQNFQLTGYTDSDTIADLGRLLNVDFVVSGSIHRLGRRNLIITTIVNVETFEQIAGGYREYRRIEDIRAILPDISKKIIAAANRESTDLPKLAVAPFNTAISGVNARDAEVLAQILAIEITDTGKYAVLPRTTTMQAALKELEYQHQGHTAEEGVKRLGQAANAGYVLAAEAGSLGKMNLFTAQILHVENGVQLTGGSREYRIIDDGIKLMAELALLLTDPENAEALIAARSRELSRAALFVDPAKMWSLGVSAGTSFAAPWVIGTVHGTIAPLRYSFLEIGLDFGMKSGVEDVGYYSFYPYIHYALFVPTGIKGGWYIGAGGGYMTAKLDYPEGKVSKNTLAADFTAGFNLWNMVDVSYTLRTNFETMDNKVSVGYTYRFK